MEKITVSNLIEFRRKKTQNSQITLLNKLRQPKKEKTDSEGGGNYWVSSISTISAVFKTNNRELLSEKIEDILKRHKRATAKQSKDMYLKNIQILKNFEDFELDEYKPEAEFNLLKKSEEKSIIKIYDLPLQVKPHHVFTFEENGVPMIGGIWFVAKKGGYSKEELNMFTDALHRYIKIHYSDKFEIQPRLCCAIDVFSTSYARYSELLENGTQSAINPTLETIKKLLGL